MQKIPCSVPILTLNAEKNLDQCLASLVDFEDVFIVDGNSTDRTHEIAKKYGRPIYKQVDSDEPNVRIKDFTAVRNRAYSMIKTEWLLDFDSDEYLSPALTDEIRAIFSKKPSMNTAYQIQNKVIFGTHKAEYAYSYPSYLIRLYAPKSGVALIPGKTIHESVVAPDHVTIETLTHPIWSYAPGTYQASIAKDNRYLDIVRTRMFSDELYKKPRPWNLLSSIGENFARAIYIILYSLWLYMRHGYQRSMPISQVARNARYSAYIGYYRFIQLYRHMRGQKSSGAPRND